MRFQLSKKIEHKGEELGEIAATVVRWHRRHKETYAHTPLAYLDQLMDALLSEQPNMTIRDVAADLQNLVPDLSENEAFVLACTKFRGFGLDTDLT